MEKVYLIIKDLITVKVEYLIFIDNIEDINTEFLCFCSAFLKSFNLETNFIDLVLKNELNINYFIDKKQDINLDIHIHYIKKLLEINENIYKITQYHNSEYYNKLNDIIYRLNKKNLPANTLNKITEIIKEDKKNKYSLFIDISSNTNFKWFWENINSKKEIRKSLLHSSSVEYNFIELSDLFNESLNEKISSNQRNYNRLLISKIKSNLDIDEDLNCINLSSNNFLTLINLKFLEEKFIDYNISKNINNEKLIKIMRFFPEFVLSFSLRETRPFLKNYNRQQYEFDNVICQEPIFFGKIKIRNVEIKLHDKAYFTQNDNDLLMKFIKELSIDNKFYNQNDNIFIL
jgi:hypothetical protein